MSSEKNYLNDSYKSFFEDSLSKKDPALYKAIQDELLRQQQHIELIASENIVSQAVLEAQGSVLTNKYAEGYPGKRYYNGCEHVDVAENLAIERLKKLFNCKFQIPLAKSYGADAILIILAGVSDDLAHELYEEALKYDMSVIVEVHTIEEAEKAL
ncbi:hypothetical protein N9Y43_02485, partial [Candidatus Pelagibacter bacterium]|nr:hypothetical protein [Candidatus Pelagibacter bacterium]